ncbi:MAG: HAD-IA family hydrolase [Crocinitomicaceae bacterium]|nr:HAD-IA family hydrolase [Crocinitomicaceae bacterium]
MKLAHIDAIIFDLGGVLIDVDYNRTILAFEKLGISNAKELYSQKAQTELFNQIECGQITPHFFLNELLKFCPKKTPINEVKEAWNAIIGPYNKRIITLLKELKKKHKLFVLSNTNAIHIEKANLAWSRISDKSIDSFFDKVYLSHKIGDRKPNASVFINICKEQGLDKNKTLFIDDSIQHIKTANKLGLKTHHLKSMEEIYSFLS